MLIFPARSQYTMEEPKTVLLPNFGSGNTTAAETIIYILCQEWPLSLKELHHRTTKECNRNVTFQAMHKATKKLVENRILTKKDFTYAINTAWLDEITEFSRITKERYKTNQPFG